MAFKFIKPKAERSDLVTFRLKLSVIDDLKAIRAMAKELEVDVNEKIASILADAFKEARKELQDYQQQQAEPSLNGYNTKTVN